MELIDRDFFLQKTGKYLSRISISVFEKKNCFFEDVNDCFTFLQGCTSRYVTMSGFMNWSCYNLRPASVDADKNFMNLSKMSHKIINAF